MDKAEVSGVETAGICSHHEKAVVRYQAGKSEMRQGSAFSVSRQSFAQQCLSAEKLIVRVSCQRLPWAASYPFYQAIIVLVQTMPDKGLHLDLVPEDQVVAGLDPACRSGQEKYSMFERTADGNDDP
jgi:hypothetical protein